jgi:outer membrane protein TolC
MEPSVELGIEKRIDAAHLGLQIGKNSQMQADDERVPSRQKVRGFIRPTFEELPASRASCRWLLAAAVIAACPAMTPWAHAEQQAAVARDKSSLGIREAIEEVLERSVAAKSARLDVGTQLQQAALAQREFLPQATLSGQSERSGATNSSSAALASTWKLRNGATVSASIGRSVVRSPGLPDMQRQSSTNTTQSIGVTQPVLRGAGFDVTKVAETLAELSATDARHEFIQSIIDLVFNTITSYFALEQAQRTVGLARESIVRQAKTRAVNDALYKAGRIARSSLLQGDVDEAQGKFALAQAEHAETVARRALLRLIAHDEQDPDRTLVVLRDSFVDQADDKLPSESQVVAVSLERRSDVRSASPGSVRATRRAISWIFIPNSTASAQQRRSSHRGPLKCSDSEPSGRCRSTRQASKPPSTPQMHP